MADEIVAGGTELPVEILGVNRKDAAFLNSVVTNGRDIPWIQDTDAAGVWAQLEITYRDVVLLDATGCVVGVYNLTDHDLGNPDHYAKLKEMLVAAATPEDSNGNCIPDSWEINTAGALLGEVGGAARGAYAFGAFAGSASTLGRGEGGALELEHRRIAGNPALSYVIEVSLDGETWILAAGAVTEIGSTPNYDGSGTETARFDLVDPQSEALFRIRAVWDCG